MFSFVVKVIYVSLPFSVLLPAMISSITSYLFGTAEEYGNRVGLADSVQLKTTPTDDEWLLVDTCK